MVAGHAVPPHMPHRVTAGHRGVSVDGIVRMADFQELARRRHGRRTAAFAFGVALTLLLSVPRGSGDGVRTMAPAEVEIPACRLGEPCPDPGFDGWAARLEVLLEARAPEMPEPTRRRVARAVVEESRASGLDPLLAAAIIDVESGFDTGARSWRGARGLMQLRPGTMAGEAARHGMAAGDPHDPVV